MKKILMGLFLILSVGVMADYDDRFEGQEEMIEQNLKFNKRNLIDEKNQVALKNIDYEVDIYNNNVIVNLEMETLSSLGDWKIFDKELFDKKMDGIAKEIKSTLKNQNIPINVSFEIDKEIGESELVYNKTF